MPKSKKVVRGLGALVMLCICGCGPVKPDADSAAVAKAAPSLPTEKPAVKSVATPELDRVKAKVARDSSGAVTSVDLRGCSIDDGVIQELSGLASVQQLDLRECVLNNDQLTSLVTPLTKLKAVRLSGKGGATSVDDAGIAALAGCKELRVLAVDELWFSVDGLKKLSSCQQLSELYAAATLLDDAALATVAEFKQLKKLRLAKSQVSHEGLKSLVGLKLEELDLSECSQITDAALEVVAKFPTLKRLNLWRDPVSDAGIAHLAALTQLTWYNLDNTQLTDAGLDHLAGMHELTFLHLGSTGVSDAGVSKLFGLKKLKDLKVTRTSVTEEGAKLIAEKIPGVEVQVKYREEEN